MVWYADYEAWGNTAQVVWREQVIDNVKVSQDELQPIRFQGQHFDVETGLHYNRFRYFDPDLGMFTTRDPIGLMGGTNVFQYAPNPTGWIDPFGLSSFDPFSVPGADITPFPENIHFGQNRASPNFSTIGSQAHPSVVGRPVLDVASDIKLGKIDPNVLPISYTIDPKTGVPVTLNNRGAAAIIESGKFPSHAVYVPYESVPAHLKADWKNKPPSSSINLTANKNGSGVVKTITNSKC